MKKPQTKRLTTDAYILKFGSLGGDWSFNEVVKLLEHEHSLTKKLMRLKRKLGEML